MQELMIHVERIVRPVRASNSRKLRMRQELLAHLQSTLDEERAHFRGDEPAAIAQARLRLGEPAELTSKLQKSVPLLERLLLARLPTSRGFDKWERRAGLRIYGDRGPMTMTHISILSAMAILSAVPLFVTMDQILKTTGMQTAHRLAFVAGAMLGSWTLLGISSRLVFAAARSDHPLNWGAILLRVLVILALQIGLAFFIAAAIADRAANLREVGVSAGATLAILALSIIVARGMSVLRRPYDQWLMLDIAE
jgi:hypothetical protein